MLKLKKHEPFGVYFLVAPCPNGRFLLAPPFQIELQGVGRRKTAFEAWTFVTWAVLEGWSPPNLRVVDSDGWICCENVWKAEKWKVLLRWSIWLVGFQLDYVFHESIGWWSDDRDSVGLVFHESFLITRDFSEIDFETVLSWTSFPPPMRHRMCCLKCLGFPYIDQKCSKKTPKIMHFPKKKVIQKPVLLRLDVEDSRNDSTWLCLMAHICLKCLGFIRPSGGAKKIGSIRCSRCGPCCGPLRPKSAVAQRRLRRRWQDRPCPVWRCSPWGWDDVVMHHML